MRIQNLKRVAIAVLLALIGLVVYYYAYEYTHQAKLEAELNTAKTQLEQSNLNSQLKEQEAQDLKDKIDKLEADLQARNAEKVRLATLAQQKAQAAPSKPVSRVTGTKAEWLAASKINPSDFTYVDYIIGRESGWNPNATNSSSGAHGLPQALPYSKTGCGWTDAVCQLNWADNYAKSRYGSWAGAYSFWLQKHWW